MATKNEKLLAQGFNALYDLIVLMKSGLPDLVSKSVDEKLESFKDLKESMNGILAQEEETAKPFKGVDSRYKYTGLEYLKMTQDERDKLDCCEFTVSQNGKLILDIFWDNTLQWILQPNEDKTEFTPVRNRPFRGLNAKFSGTACQFLKEMADEEIVEPGSFAKKNYPSRPKVIIRRAEKSQEQTPSA